MSEQAIDTHAEAADRFLLLSVAMAGLVAVGLLRNKAGSASRVVAVFAAAGLGPAAQRRIVPSLEDVFIHAIENAEDDRGAVRA